MPNVTVFCGKRQVRLTDKDYLAAGGEATVYVKGGVAYRIQHEPATLPPLQKLEELRAVNCPKAVVPLEMLTDSAGTTVGFTMRFLDQAEPVARLFNRVFKTQQGIGPSQIGELTEDLRISMSQIHGAGCVVVDFNAYNILVPTSGWNNGYIIDTASWATPSFPATAIMTDIRDPQVHGNRFNALSDWYSWGIIAFQLYTGTHPFKGKHPAYSAAEWTKRMAENASVFDSGVVLPPTVEPFTSIPARHLDWFKDVFSNGRRCEPPSLLGQVVTQVQPAAKVAVNNRGKFTVTELCTMPGTIADVFVASGSLFLVGSGCVWDEKGTVRYRATVPSARLFVTETEDHQEPVVVELHGGRAVFKIMRTLQPVAAVDSVKGLFLRSGKVYLHQTRNLTVNSVAKYGSNWQLKSMETEQLSELSAKTADGCVVQDLFSTIWVALPTESGHSVTCKIAEIGARNESVVAARFEGRVLVLLAKNRRTNAYSRHVVTFNDASLEKYQHRVEDNVGLDEPNFTCVPNGPVVLVIEDAVEVFVPGRAIMSVVGQPPFDANMPLRFHNGVMFIHGSTLYRVRMS